MTSSVALDRLTLQTLARIPTGRVVRDLALTWGLVILTLSLAARTSSWLVGAVMFVAMACLQNALVLWTHEASHMGLSRNRTWNDRLGDLLVAGPAGVTVAGYRWQHMRHHQMLGNPDEEIDLAAWTCLRGPRFVRVILWHLCGAASLQTIARYGAGATDARYRSRPPRSAASWLGLLVGNGLLLALCVAQGRWWAYLACWAAPLVTLTVLIGNLRTVVEHQPSSRVCDSGLIAIEPVTRLTRYTWLERRLIAPLGFAYHWEHHLYPGIPYAHLPALREELARLGGYDDPALPFANGYCSTLWQLATSTQPPRASGRHHVR